MVPPPRSSTGATASAARSGSCSSVVVVTPMTAWLMSSAALPITSGMSDKIFERLMHASVSSRCWRASGSPRSSVFAKPGVGTPTNVYGDLRKLVSSRADSTAPSGRSSSRRCLNDSGPPFASMRACRPVGSDSASGGPRTAPPPRSTEAGTQPSAAPPLLLPPPPRVGFSDGNWPSYVTSPCRRSRRACRRSRRCRLKAAAPAAAPASHSGEWSRRCCRSTVRSRRREPGRSRP